MAYHNSSDFGTNISNAESKRKLMFSYSPDIIRHAVLHSKAAVFLCYPSICVHVIKL